MSVLLFILCVSGVIAYRMTTPEERARYAGILREFIEPMRKEALRGRQATAPFREAVRARTRWAVVTTTILILNLVVFIRMALSGATIDAPETLIAFGASFGPQTTNGEWWRLVTAMFVHTSLLHLLANSLGLLKVGVLLERLIGPVTFACVYVAAGMFASLVSLTEHPLAVHVGASGAIFGVYGLLVAVTTWTLIKGGLRIPLMVFQGLAAGALLFVVYTAFTSGVTSPPNSTGFIVGLACGFALAKDVGQARVPVRATAIATVIAAVLMVYVALPLRGIVDIRPEIARLMTIEDRTATPYLRAVDRLTTGRSNTVVLAGMIQGKIMPELEAARARISSLERVHQQHQPLVADAEEYLRLREQSWRLRAEGLQKGSSQTLREADRTERASLQALTRLKSVRLTPDIRT